MGYWSIGTESVVHQQIQRLLKCYKPQFVPFFMSFLCSKASLHTSKTTIEMTIPTENTANLSVTECAVNVAFVVSKISLCRIQVSKQNDVINVTEVMSSVFFTGHFGSLHKNLDVVSI